MGIWIELGVFVLAIGFGLWQIHDVKKARAATLRARAQAQEELEKTQRSEAVHQPQGVQEESPGPGPVSGPR